MNKQEKYKPQQTITYIPVAIFQIAGKFHIMK